MALTQISTDGVKDDAVTAGKIPANAVGSSELADNAVDTNAIQNDAVNNDKIANSAVNTAQLADSAVHTQKINDDAITTDKLANSIVNDINANSAKVQTTINNNADNRVITGSGTANTLNGESSVVIDANGKLGVGTTSPVGLLDLDGGSSSFFMQFKETSGNWHRMGIKKNNSLLQLGELNNAGTSFTPILSVQANGDSVGIGTTAPSRPLHIASDEDLTSFTGTTKGAFCISNNDYASGEYSAIDFTYTGSDNPIGRIATKITSGGTHLSLGTSDNYSNGITNEALTIDTNGRVIKANQPAFLAYHHGYDLTYTSGDSLAYMHEAFDIGSNYNTSNYTFTAPIAGRYLFSASANAAYDSSLSGVPRAYWKINGSNVANNIHLRGSDNANTGADADGLEQRSQTVIFNLSANDTVRIDVGQNKWDLFGANSFCGYLLG